MKLETTVSYTDPLNPQYVCQFTDETGMKFTPFSIAALVDGHAKDSVLIMLEARNKLLQDNPTLDTTVMDIKIAEGIKSRVSVPAQELTSIQF